MKKIFLNLLVGAAFFMFSSHNICAQSKSRLALGTSTPGGNYYLVGGGWANIITNNTKNIEVTAEVTGGSTANLTMIQNGDLDIGVTMGSTVIEGLEGKQMWTQGEKKDKVRIMLPLYPSEFTLYCLEKTPINSLSDLNNIKVGTGNLGAGVDSIAKAIFKEFNIKPSQIHNDSHNNTVRAVGDEIIDAGISFQYPPYPALLDLEASKNIKYIGLTDNEVDKILKRLPFLSKGIIPKDSYKGAHEDIQTVEDWNWLVCSADLDESLVYEMVKTTFNHKDSLLIINKALKNVDPKNYINSPGKLHPGVVKYLKELNVDIPKELLP